MAEGTSEVERFAQGNYVDAVRWLPPVAAFDRVLATATYDVDSGVSSVQINTLTQQNPTDSPRLELQTSWISPARISRLKVGPYDQKAIIAGSSRSGYLLFLVADPLEASLDAESSLFGQSLHKGAISGMDLQTGTCECVSVGEDGKINLVKLAEAQLQNTCVFDNRGLISYTAACWASPVEFVTAALGFRLQWWDHRKPGGPVSQSPKNWIGGSTMGVIHSIDVHPSRKHVCVVGGSSGSVFAWDLRWQQEPIPLLGIGSSTKQISGILSESEVWEVKYDHYIQSVSLGAASSKIPPVMMCSEDGILAVLESDTLFEIRWCQNVEVIHNVVSLVREKRVVDQQTIEKAFIKEGEAPLEILAEPCAINTFDIDPENSSDAICALEWETILFLKRS